MQNYILPEFNHVLIELMCFNIRSFVYVKVIKVEIKRQRNRRKIFLLTICCEDITDRASSAEDNLPLGL